MASYQKYHFHVAFAKKKKKNVFLTESKNHHILPNCFQFVKLIICHCVLIYCSADEPMVRFQHKVSASLKQALEKLKLSENTAEQKGECIPSHLYFSMFHFALCILDHHPLLVVVDRKVMLTAKVNGQPLGIRPHLCHSHHGIWVKADRDRTTHHNWVHFKKILFRVLTSLLSSLSFQRKIATRSRSGHPVKTEGALK